MTKKDSEVEDNKEDSKLLQFWNKFWGVVTFFFGSGLIAIVLRILYLYEVYEASSFDFFNLWLPLKLLLALLFVAGIVIALVYMKKGGAPNRAIFFFLFSTLCGIILAIQRENMERMILVYDQHTVTYHPDSLKGQTLEIKRINDIPQMNQLKELDNNVILISAVDRPVHRWKNTIKEPSNFKSKVYSLHQIIEKETGFIDISFSDFEDDVVWWLKQQDSVTDIRIYFEDEFSQLQIRLRELLKRKFPSAEISPIVFTSSNTKLLTNEETDLIFIGSTKGLKRFNKVLSVDHKFRDLIIPSWLRPQVQARGEGRRFCIVSSEYEKLIEKDHETWSMLVQAIKEDAASKNSNGANVTTRFTRNDEKMIIKF